MLTLRNLTERHTNVVHVGFSGEFGLQVMEELMARIKRGAKLTPSERLAKAIIEAAMETKLQAPAPSVFTAQPHRFSKLGVEDQTPPLTQDEAFEEYQKVLYGGGCY